MRKLHGWKLGFSRCFWFIWIAAGGGMFPQRSAAAIAYVQGNYLTPQSPQQTVSVKYLATQAAGDLNVVIVGWKNTASVVSSVSDTRGNSYQLAVEHLPAISKGRTAATLNCIGRRTFAERLKRGDKAP
jgi:hypothetical protein